MNRPTRLLTIFCTALLMALSLTAFAHTGHSNADSHGFLDGLSHPFFGADHLIAMLLVGAWGVLNARKAWLAPMTFMAALTVGTLFGQNGLSVPQLEPLVASSVLVIGLMLTVPFRLGAALAIIGSFAVFHGMAHGSELSANGTVLAGILAGSALLHLIGMVFAKRVLTHRPAWTVRLGQVAALIGGGLVLSAVL
jgi:urease accessory protein